MLLLVLSIANIILILYLLNKKIKILDIRNIILNSIKECSDVFIIILLMGATISAWLSSGIVPSLIYYGFNYMASINFILAAFIGTMMISFVMGTACGTLSTLGIAMLGIGTGLGIPKVVLLGAIVSGSFIADKMAPLSSLTNLTIQITDVNYRDFLKTSLVTFIPSLILTMLIYTFLGMKYSSNIDMNIIYKYQEYISQGFFISPLFLAFPLFVIVLAFTGLKTSYNMSIGIFVAFLATVFIQKVSIIDMVKSLLWGYSSQTGMIELDTLISGGGIFPMMEVVLVVMASVSLSGLLENSNLLRPIAEHFYKDKDGKPELIYKTGILSIMFTAMTCDQTVGILMPTRFAKKKFDDKGIPRSILARTISDTGTIVAPLMPWNVNALIIYGITQISALSYGPYAVLCFIAPLVTILSGFFKPRKINTSPDISNSIDESIEL